MALHDHTVKLDENGLYNDVNIDGVSRAPEARTRPNLPGRKEVSVDATSLPGDQQDGIVAETAVSVIRSYHHHRFNCTAPMRRFHGRGDSQHSFRTLGIINLGDIPGTFADGTPLDGSSRAPWPLSKPWACAPQRPLQVRRPPYCWWHHHGSDCLRMIGAGTGITSRALHCSTLPRIYSLRRRRRGEGLKGLLKAVGIPGGRK